MGTEIGKQMGLAIQAVLRMQEDCVRLFRDLDKALDKLRPISGNTITAGTGYSMNAPQLYLPKLLFRRYAPSGSDHLVLGVSAWFHNHPERASDEPLFIVGNVQYTPEAPDSNEESCRPWDPLAAFWDWGSARTFGQALTVDPKRSTITKIVVAAEPLYSINSIEAARSVIDLVGHS